MAIGKLETDLEAILDSGETYKAVTKALKNVLKGSKKVLKCLKKVLEGSR